MDMPRPRPPYLMKETSRHGKVMWYVRKGDGPRIRIRGEFGSPEFTVAYQAAVHGTPPAPQGKAKPPAKETLAWLVDQYRQSSDWSILSHATKRQKQNIFNRFLFAGGDAPFADITKKHIMEAIDRRRETPFAAKNFLKTIRAVFNWAVERGHLEDNPCTGVRAKTPKTDGFHTWTLDECEKFEKHWPLGTGERLAYDILLYTGLRRDDAIKLNIFNARNGVITVATGKTKTTVSIRMLPPLLKSIEAGPCGEVVFIVGKKGKPRKNAAFGNWFKEACVAAKVPGAAHGLRKAGSIKAAEAGATTLELMAMYGWKDWNTAETYVRLANRAKMALKGWDKTGEEQG